MPRMKVLGPLLSLLLLFGLGCSKSQDAKPESKFDPCDHLREADPHCGWKPHWYHSEGKTNAIDGTKSDFLSLESTDADGVNFGRLQYATLRLCFENKKLCGHRAVGVGVTVNGMLQPSSGLNYATPVRLKFDDEQAARQTWGISDDHDTLFPSGREKQFFSQLLGHNKLVLEFSYYQKAPRTITFDLAGLSDTLQTNALLGPTGEPENAETRSKRLAAVAVDRTRSEQQRAADQKRRVDDQKRLAALQKECAPFVDGSAEQVQAKTMALPPKECREILPWTHDGYLDALYNLQNSPH
jgi:hypothetical protein